MIKLLAGTGIAGSITQILVRIDINPPLQYEYGELPCCTVRVNYRNGGIFYRSARDGYGLKLTGQSFTPQPANPLREMLCIHAGRM